MATVSARRGLEVSTPGLIGGWIQAVDVSTLQLAASSGGGRGQFHARGAGGLPVGGDLQPFGEGLQHHHRNIVVQMASSVAVQLVDEPGDGRLERAGNQPPGCPSQVKTFPGPVEGVCQARQCRGGAGLRGAPRSGPEAGHCQPREGLVGTDASRDTDLAIGQTSNGGGWPQLAIVTVERSIPHITAVTNSSPSTSAAVRVAGVPGDQLVELVSHRGQVRGCVSHGSETSKHQRGQSHAGHAVASDVPHKCPRPEAGVKHLVTIPADSGGARGRLVPRGYRHWPDYRGRLTDDGLLGRFRHGRQFDDAPLAFDPEGGRLSGEQRAGDDDHDRGHTGMRLIAVQEVEPGGGGDGGAAQKATPAGRTPLAAKNGAITRPRDVRPAGEGQVDHGQNGQHRRRHSHPGQFTPSRGRAAAGARPHRLPT